MESKFGKFKGELKTTEAKESEEILKEKEAIITKIMEEARTNYRELVNHDLRCDDPDKSPLGFEDLSVVFRGKCEEFCEKLGTDFLKPEEIQYKIKKLKDEIEWWQKELENENKQKSELEAKTEKTEYDGNIWKGLMQQIIEVEKKIDSTKNKVKKFEENINKLEEELLEAVSKSQEVKKIIPTITEEAEKSYENWSKEAHEEKDWSKYKEWQMEKKGYLLHLLDIESIVEMAEKEIPQKEEKIISEEKEKFEEEKNRNKKI